MIVNHDDQYNNSGDSDGEVYMGRNKIDGENDEKNENEKNENINKIRKKLRQNEVQFGTNLLMKPQYLYVANSIFNIPPPDLSNYGKSINSTKKTPPQGLKKNTSICRLSTKIEKDDFSLPHSSLPGDNPDDIDSNDDGQCDYGRIHANMYRYHWDSGHDVVMDIRKRDTYEDLLLPYCDIHTALQTYQELHDIISGAIDSDQEEEDFGDGECDEKNNDNDQIDKNPNIINSDPNIPPITPESIQNEQNYQNLSQNPHQNFLNGKITLTPWVGFALVNSIVANSISKILHLRRTSIHFKYNDQNGSDPTSLPSISTQIISPQYPPTLTTTDKTDIHTIGSVQNGDRGQLKGFEGVFGGDLAQINPHTISLSTQSESDHTPAWIWIHSYQFMLLPTRLREIAQFSQNYQNEKENSEKNDQKNINSLSLVLNPPSPTPTPTPQKLQNFRIQRYSPYHTLSNCKNIKILFSLHTPFPPSDMFAQLPWRMHLLQSCLSADVITLQSYDFARHFLASCHRLLEMKGNTDSILSSLRLLQQYSVNNNNNNNDDADNFDKNNEKNEISTKNDINNDNNHQIDPNSDELLILSGLNRITPSRATMIGLGGGTVGMFYKNRVTSVFNSHVGIRTEPQVSQTQLSFFAKPITAFSLLKKINKKMVKLKDSYITRTWLLAQHDIRESTALCSLQDGSYFLKRNIFIQGEGNSNNNNNNNGEKKVKKMSHQTTLQLDFCDNFLRNCLQYQRLCAIVGDDNHYDVENTDLLNSHTENSPIYGNHIGQVNPQRNHQAGQGVGVDGMHGGAHVHVQGEQGIFVGDANNASTGLDSALHDIHDVKNHINNGSNQAQYPLLTNFNDDNILGNNSFGTNNFNHFLVQNHQNNIKNDLNDLNDSKNDQNNNNNNQNDQNNPHNSISIQPLQVHPSKSPLINPLNSPKRTNEHYKRQKIRQNALNEYVNPEKLNFSQFDKKLLKKQLLEDYFFLIQLGHKIELPSFLIDHNSSPSPLIPIKSSLPSPNVIIPAINTIKDSVSGEVGVEMKVQKEEIEKIGENEKIEKNSIKTGQINSHDDQDSPITMPKHTTSYHSGLEPTRFKLDDNLPKKNIKKISKRNKKTNNEQNSWCTFSKLIYFTDRVREILLEENLPFPFINNQYPSHDEHNDDHDGDNKGQNCVENDSKNKPTKNPTKTTLPSLSRKFHCNCAKKTSETCQLMVQKLTKAQMVPFLSLYQQFLVQKAVQSRCIYHNPSLRRRYLRSLVRDSVGDGDEDWESEIDEDDENNDENNNENNEKNERIEPVEKMDTTTQFSTKIPPPALIQTDTSDDDISDHDSTRCSGHFNNTTTLSVQNYPSSITSETSSHRNLQDDRNNQYSSPRSSFSTSPLEHPMFALIQSQKIRSEKSPAPHTPPISAHTPLSIAGSHNTFHLGHSSRATPESGLGKDKNGQDNDDSYDEKHGELINNDCIDGVGDVLVKGGRMGKGGTIQLKPHFSFSAIPKPQAASNSPSNRLVMYNDGIRGAGAGDHRDRAELSGNGKRMGQFAGDGDEKCDKNDERDENFEKLFNYPIHYDIISDPIVLSVDSKIVALENNKNYGIGDILKDQIEMKVKNNEQNCDEKNHFFENNSQNVQNNLNKNDFVNISNNISPKILPNPSPRLDSSTNTSNKGTTDSSPLLGGISDVSGEKNRPHNDPKKLDPKKSEKNNEKNNENNKNDESEIPIISRRKLIVSMTGITPISAPHLQLQAYRAMLAEQPELVQTSTMVLLLYTGLSSYATEGGYSPLISVNKSYTARNTEHKYDFGAENERKNENNENNENILNKKCSQKIIQNKNIIIQRAKKLANYLQITRQKQSFSAQSDVNFDKTHHNVVNRFVGMDEDSEGRIDMILSDDKSKAIFFSPKNEQNLFLNEQNSYLNTINDLIITPNNEIPIPESTLPTIALNSAKKVYKSLFSNFSHFSANNPLENPPQKPHPSILTSFHKLAQYSKIYTPITDNYTDIPFTALYKYDGFHDSVLDVEASLVPAPPLVPHHGSVLDVEATLGRTPLLGQQNRRYHQSGDQFSDFAYNGDGLDQSGQNMSDFETLFPNLIKKKPETLLEQQKRVFMGAGLQLHFGASSQITHSHHNTSNVVKEEPHGLRSHQSVLFHEGNTAGIDNQARGVGKGMLASQQQQQQQMILQQQNRSQSSTKFGNFAQNQQFLGGNNPQNANNLIQNYSQSTFLCQNKHCICQEELLRLSSISANHHNCSCVRMGPYMHSILAQVQCLRYNYGPHIIKCTLGVMSGTNSFYYAHSQCEPHQFTDHFLHCLCPIHGLFKMPWCFRSSVALYRAADVLMCNTFWDGLALIPLVATTLTHQLPATHLFLSDDGSDDKNGKNNDKNNQNNQNNQKNYTQFPYKTLQQQRQCNCSGCLAYKYGLQKPMVVKKTTKQIVYKKVMEINETKNGIFSDNRVNNIENNKENFSNFEHFNNDQNNIKNIKIDQNVGNTDNTLQSTDLASNNAITDSTILSDNSTIPFSHPISISTASFNGSFSEQNIPEKSIKIENKNKNLSKSAINTIHHHSHLSNLELDCIIDQVLLDSTQNDANNANNTNNTNNTPSNISIDPNITKSGPNTHQLVSPEVLAPCSDQDEKCTPKKIKKRSKPNKKTPPPTKYTPTTSTTSSYTILQPSSYFRPPPMIMVSEFQGSSRSVTGVVRSNPLSVKEVATGLGKCLNGPSSADYERYKQHLLRFNQAFKYPFLAWTAKCLNLLHESYKRNNENNKNWNFGYGNK
jgi:hypothetical protein